MLPRLQGGTDKSASIATADLKFKVVIYSANYLAASGVSDFGLNSKDVDYIYKADNNTTNMEFNSPLSSNIYSADSNVTNLEMGIKDTYYIYKVDSTPNSLGFIVNDSGVEFLPETSSLGLSVNNILSQNYIKKAQFTHTALTSDVEREVFPSTADFSYEPYNSKLKYIIDTSESDFTSVIKAFLYDPTPSIRYEREASIVRSIYKIVEIDRKEDIDASTK